MPKHIKSMQSADNSIPEGTESNHTNDLSAMRSSDNASAPSTQASATEEAISPTKTSVTAQEHSVSGAAQPSPRSEKAKTSIKGIPSNTLLYVSHLSYSVNNDTLMEFFAPYGVKSAKVIRHRHRPSLSRGFAFVDFSSHENQQKAMLEKNGVELHGRSISITGMFLSYDRLIHVQWPCSLPRRKRTRMSLTQVPTNNSAKYIPSYMLKKYLCIKDI